MEPTSSDTVDKLQSHLQVYGGLIQNQAVEIASLKAEVAYLKKQLKARDDGANGLQAGQVRWSQCMVLILLFVLTRPFRLNQQLRQVFVSR